MARFTPTEEQMAILAADSHSPVVKIEGRAGAAKTSTLELVAQQRNSRGFYVSFNKSISEEASRRFPRLVTAKTIHSVAYSAMGMRSQSHKLKSRVFPEEMVKASGLQIRALSPMLVGASLSSVINQYCLSSDDVLNEGHVTAGIMDIRVIETISMDKLVYSCRRIFSRMASRTDSFPMTHDVYLKLWQLSGSKMPDGIEWIMFDEAQDANGVLLAAMDNQTVPVTWVGDPHQQIYRFRGAVNVMAMIPSQETMFLTQSFRFGQIIADLANAILSCKPEASRPVQPIRGHQQIDTHVGPFGREPRQTFLSRTNAECFREALRFRGTVHVIGGLDALLRLVSSAWNLWSGGSRSDMLPEISRFSSWDSLVDAAEVTKDPELTSVVRLIDEFRGSILDKVRDVSSRHVGVEADADYVLSTFHRSKGREWERVRIGGQGMRCPIDPRWDNLSLSEKEDEINLVYVAVTRGQRFVEIPEELLSFLPVGKINGWSGQVIDENFDGNLVLTGRLDNVQEKSAPSEKDVSETDLDPVTEDAALWNQFASLGIVAPGDKDAPTTGCWTVWQSQVVSALYDKAPLMVVARLVQRHPEAVRIRWMFCSGVDKADIVSEIRKSVYRFGGSKVMLEQLKHAAAEQIG